MPHFAYIENGIVRRVERIEASVMTDADGVEREALGQSFLAGLYEGTAPTDFVLAHYPVGQPDPFPRGKYPARGDLWDGDQFVDPPDPGLPPTASST